MDAANIRQWAELFERDIDHQYVSGEQVARASKLIEAIGREATARGFAVMAPSAGLLSRARRDKWAWPHIVASTQDGHMLSFHLAECSMAGTPPKPRTLADRRSPDGTPTWQMQRSTRFAPTGVMSIKVDCDIAHYRVKTSRDSDNSTVESRLPNLFDALVEELVRCGDLKRRVGERRRRERDSRMRYRTERMYAALCDETERHELMRRQRDYLDAVESRLGDGATAGAASDDIRLAIAAMRRHIDAHDPLSDGGTAWARQPEPTEAEMFAYERGLDGARPDGNAPHRAPGPAGRHATAPHSPAGPPAPPQGPAGRHRAKTRATDRPSGFFD